MKICFQDIREDARHKVATLQHRIKATKVGGQREMNALLHGLNHTAGKQNSDKDWFDHINSAHAECLGCEEFGLDWVQVLDPTQLRDANGRKIADGVHPVTGKEVDFRARPEFWQDLIVRPDDPDDRAYFLVVGTAPDYYLQGWLLGSEAKRYPATDPTGTGRDKAHFVQAYVLHSSDDFEIWVKT